MRGPQPLHEIRLSGGLKAQLRQECRARSAEHRYVERRRIVLLAGKGLSNTEIARRLECGREKVIYWRLQFVRGGVAALVEKSRSGRPGRITSQERHEIVAMACRLPTEFGVERSHWSISSIQKAALDTGRVKSISTTSVWTILNHVDLRPHHFRMWMFSHDPYFDSKMQDLVDLYTVRAREGEVVLSIDEKTSIQALERKEVIVTPRPGQPGLYESEYIRHGTTCLFACFNIGTGKVMGWCNPTRKQPDFLKFLDQVADHHPTGVVHLVLDNLNTHVSQPVRDWNHQHGDRFRIHFTPLHASWLNQVEIWFGLLQRERLKHSSFSSIDDLTSALYRYIDQWNRERAHPFEWTWKGYPLRRGVSPPLARKAHARGHGADLMTEFESLEALCAIAHNRSHEARHAATCSAPEWLAF